MEHNPSPRGNFSRIPGFFWLSGVLQGMEHNLSPRGKFSRIPGFFWLSGRAFDSVPTGRWFEPRLPSTFIFLRFLFLYFFLFFIIENDFGVLLLFFGGQLFFALFF